MLGEDQLYRIDHYLGKETVQNILAFRFRNAFFEPLWNQKHVDLVQITVAENLGLAHGLAITMSLGRCATSCKTTPCSYLPWSPWNHLQTSMPTAFAPKKRRYCKAYGHRRRWCMTLTPTLFAPSMQAIWTSRGCRKIPKPKPMSRLVLTSTTGAGVACHSSSVPANICLSALPRFRSNSACRRIRSSDRGPSVICAPMPSLCGFSRKKASMSTLRSKAWLRAKYAASCPHL